MVFYRKIEKDADAPQENSEIRDLQSQITQGIEQHKLI